MFWDAIRFCQDYSIQVILPGESSSGKVSQGWIGVQCPNPSCTRNDRDDYGGFNVLKGYYSCWNCGGHSLPTVIHWFLHVDFKEAERIQWEYSRTSTPLAVASGKNPVVHKVKKVELPGSALKKVHKQYLKGRGFDPEYLEKKYGLLGTTAIVKKDADFGYLQRIIIPIADRSGRVISFQGRDYTGTSKLRYKGCSVADSIQHYKHTLYGLPFCTSDKVCLVEGVFDAWKMGDGFVCSFGTAVTDYQIKELAFFDQIFILFDPEDTAQSLAKKTAHKLAALGKSVEVLCSDLDVDPGDFPESEVKFIRRELKL